MNRKVADRLTNWQINEVSRHINNVNGGNRSSSGSGNSNCICWHVCNSTIHISNAIYLMKSIVKNVSHVSDIYNASRTTGLHCSPNLLLQCNHLLSYHSSAKAAVISTDLNSTKASEKAMVCMSYALIYRRTKCLKGYDNNNLQHTCRNDGMGEWISDQWLNEWMSLES